MYGMMFLLACSPSDSSTGKDTANRDSNAQPDSTDSAVDSGHTGETAETGDSADTADTEDSGIDTGPVECDRSLGWKSVEAGYQLTCGIHTDGCAECWGRGEDDEDSHYNYHGEDRPPPGDYASIDLSNTKEYETGHDPGACGILTDGTLSCWTWDRFTEPGPYTSVGVYDAGGYALTATGELYTWGGVGEPSEAVFRSLSVGYYEGLAIQADGTIRWWRPYDYPERNELTIEGSWVAAAAGLGACGIDTAGEVTCWTDYAGPYDLGGTPSPAGPFTDICVTGRTTACALDPEGQATCWGEWHDVVDGTPPDARFSMVSCGANHVCGVTTDGDIQCWGRDDYGETEPPT